MKFAIPVALLLAGCMAGQVGAQDTELQWRAQPHVAQPVVHASPKEVLDTLPVNLALDDGSAEASTGLIAPGGARQFLWFNRFASPGQFTLEQIRVLFPAAANVAAGDAVQLVVYRDPDGDPTNGASLLASINATVQAVDGVTFSVYDLASPVQIPTGGDVLIGVVNRFVVSGVSPASFPAAIDTGSSQQRSWLVAWTGDPPAMPTLPSDGPMALVDTLLPGVAGNWMIRGFGSRPAPLAVPSSNAVGLGMLALLMVLATYLRRSRTRLRSH